MIDVALTPARVPAARVAVVIDVLRAGSSITEALAGGYRRVHCCATVEDARGLRSPDRVLAGERGCMRPAGFDLGNSPADFRLARADEVALTTTNGCPALIAAARIAEEVLVGCLLNLDAVLARLEGESDVALICSGTDGAPALEDVYLAGRLAARCGGERSDAARIAEAVARDHASALEALAASADAAVLRRVGLAADIEWCARESVSSCVPRVVRATERAVVLEAGPAASGRRGQRRAARAQVRAY